VHRMKNEIWLPRGEKQQICLIVHASPQNSTPFAPRCEPSAGTSKDPVFHDARSMTRLAVMGGSYGNVPALSACLAHAKREGCDGFAFIGDSTGCCGHSDETIRIIRDNFTFLVAGNHEQKAASGDEDCGCNYSNEEDNHYGGIAHRWALQSLSDQNRQWLGSWPDLAIVETIAGRILLCHGSPAQTNEFLYESALDDSRLNRWLDQFNAVGLVCTHSGFPWIRRLTRDRFAVNCGVCGKADHDHDAAVHYATVELRSDEAPRLNIERVEYDHLAFADQLDREGVDDVFTIPIRNGVWTCGLLSMPAMERVLRSRPPGWLEALISPKTERA
jgi:diadenosine tetraphosphatase ApaH/serine/threonine PP2A family protein phosphatase